jgi:hypothetical protein
MELVWPLILEEFPIFVDMAKWLEEHIFIKIRRGIPIEVNSIQLEGAKPIYQMMLDAVESSDTTMTGK